jgi:hypothetical protein
MWTPPNTCRGCGAEILWAVTENGRRMPVDPARYPREDDKANLAVYTDHLRRVRVRVISADRPLAGFEHRGMPHAATCSAEAAARAAKAAAQAAHPSGKSEPRRGLLRRPAPPSLVADVPLEVDVGDQFVDELAARRRRRRTSGASP